MKYFKHESSFVDDGATIGEDVHIWHFSHVCAGAVIGSKTRIGQNVYVGNKVVIGRGCKIQNNVSVYDDVTLEDDVFCGPSMVFTNVINPRSNIERKSEYKSTLVQKGATIGANATIICGVRIGKYSLIGAGALVTKDVKPYALMIGVPAKQSGWVSEAGIKLSENLTCPSDGSKYYLDSNGELIKSDE